MSALEFNFGDSSARPGWRLLRLEMLNWGTFGGGRVHVLEPACGWSLLVGENGSGKSTAIDALRTLLVPRTVLRGSFNDAAGGQGKRDRSLVSYIRGQWSSSREDDAADSTPAFLRPEDTPTILLAVFGNEQRNAKLTLAQWLVVTNGKDTGQFLVSPEEKSIANDLQGLGSGREMTRQLKEKRFACYEGYTGYFRDFGQRMGVPDQSAMEIFNQAIGIKEVVSVNDFLRRHLLTRGDALDRIREKIIPSFANLEECWNSIQRDKDQIALLTPIVEAHERVEQANRAKVEIERLIERLPIYYGRQHAKMLTEELQQLTEALNRHAAAISSADQGIAELEKQRDELKSAIDRDESTLRIERLKLEIERVEKMIQERRKKHQDCATAAKRCDLGEFHDEITFSALQSKAAGHQRTLEDNKEAADQHAHEAGVQERELLPKIEQTERDLKSLRERQVLIPHDFQLIRDMICSQTGLSQADLPFAGELIEVKPEREEWVGAIERLMHTFGVSLLVPEHCYQRVAPLFNRRRLMDATGRKGLRFHFHRVPSHAVSRPSLASGIETVAHCLNFRQEHPMARWVESEAARTFNHVCCRDTQELEQQNYGITREGLIRGGSRHVKDDRQLISDRTQYVLGWSPKRKIEALERSLDELKLELAAAKRAVQKARDEAKKMELDLGMLAGLLAISLYAEIDFSAAVVELEKFQGEKSDLEASSEARQKLTRQHADVLETIKSQRAMRDEVLKQKNSAQNSLEAAESKKDEIDRQLAGFPADDEPLPEAHTTLIAEIENGAEHRLGSIEQIERKTADGLRGKANVQARIISSGREAMGSPMQKFLEKYGEEGKDLAAKPEYSGDFTRLYQRLVNEALPDHEERFREFLNENLIQYVGGLDAALSQEVKAHHQRITLVNAALARLEYAHGTHVQVHDPVTRDPLIRDFKGQLRDILGTGMNLEGEQERLALFEKMQKLIARFRTDLDWMKKVADSRNWIDFGIRELRTSDQQQVNYYDSSLGKSGGQKAKLAFNVLAAALHAQYGLAEDDTRADTFRLVIIDEIFARTDEPNSKRALELFKNMGFQLLLAAPWEAKVRIAENFVDSYHLALNPNLNASSVLKADRARYEAVREQSLKRPESHGQPQ